MHQKAHKNPDLVCKPGKKWWQPMWMRMMAKAGYGYDLPWERLTTVCRSIDEMRKIGAVLARHEEFEKVIGRVEEVRSERKYSPANVRLLSNGSTSLKNVVEAFMTAFRAIDANFREWFARVTSGIGHCSGEEEDPFQGVYVCSPARDKRSTFLCLSGGEKSLRPSLSSSPSWSLFRRLLCVW